MVIIFIQKDFIWKQLRYQIEHFKSKIVTNGVTL